MLSPDASRQPTSKEEAERSKSLLGGIKAQARRIVPLNCRWCFGHRTISLNADDELWQVRCKACGYVVSHRYRDIAVEASDAYGMSSCET